MNTIDTEMAWRWTQAGDNAMKKEDYRLAVSIFINAFSINEIEGAKYLLPRISACYRRMNSPQSAIDFYKKALKKHGNRIVDKVVLTSIAGAYGDLDKWDEALKCANLATGLNDGIIDVYLENVYGRINYNLRCN